MSARATAVGRLAALLTALLGGGGCMTHHFAEQPTPNNLVADVVNNLAVGAGTVVVGVVALPVMAVSGLADAIHTEPCPPRNVCDPLDPCHRECCPPSCEPPCEHAPCCPCAPCPPPLPCAPAPLPVRYRPGWERERGGWGKACG